MSEFRLGNKKIMDIIYREAITRKSELTEPPRGQFSVTLKQRKKTSIMEKRKKTRNTQTHTKP